MGKSILYFVLIAGVLIVLTKLSFDAIIAIGVALVVVKTKKVA